MPKSSMAMRTPRSRRFLIRCKAMAASRGRAFSVISSSRRSGASPVRLRTLCTMPGKVGSSSCSGDTLTATKEDGAGQPAAASQACVSISSPISAILPSSSASRNEVVRKDEATAFPPPAGEGFEPGRASAVQIDQRLEVALDFLVGDGALKSADAVRAPAVFGGEFLVEPADLDFRRAIGQGEGVPAGAQQAVGRVHSLSTQRAAGLDAQLDLAVAGGHRLQQDGDGVADVALRRRRRRRGRGGEGEDVRREARDKRRRHGAKPIAEQADERRVVDRLGILDEAVEVGELDLHDPHPAARVRLGQQGVEIGKELALPGKAGGGIVAQELGNSLFGPDLRIDVERDADHAPRLSVRSDHVAAYMDPAIKAVFAAQPLPEIVGLLAARHDRLAQLVVCFVGLGRVAALAQFRHGQFMARRQPQAANEFIRDVGNLFLAAGEVDLPDAAAGAGQRELQAALVFERRVEGGREAFPGALQQREDEQRGEGDECPSLVGLQSQVLVIAAGDAGKQSIARDDPQGTDDGIAGRDDFGDPRKYAFSTAPAGCIVSTCRMAWMQLYVFFIFLSQPTTRLTYQSLKFPVAAS